jgi:hypothetical protein
MTKSHFKNDKFTRQREDKLRRQRDERLQKHLAAQRAASARPGRLPADNMAKVAATEQKVKDA